jgi:hypothetical protein
MNPATTTNPAISANTSVNTQRSSGRSRPACAGIRVTSFPAHRYFRA